MFKQIKPFFLVYYVEYIITLSSFDHVFMCSHLVDPFRNHGTDSVEGLVIRRMRTHFAITRKYINLAFHTLFSAQLAAFRAAAIASTVAMCWIAAFAVECGAFHSIAKHVSTCATRKTRAAMTKRMITLIYILQEGQNKGGEKKIEQHVRV